MLIIYKLSNPQQLHRWITASPSTIAPPSNPPPTMASGYSPGSSPNNSTMMEKPPIIRVRCEGDSLDHEEGCYSSSGSEDPHLKFPSPSSHHLLTKLPSSTLYNRTDKRHSAPDIRLTTLLGGLRRHSGGTPVVGGGVGREKRLSGPHLPPSPLTLAPGSYSQRSSLDDGSLEHSFAGRRWARLRNRREDE